MKKLGLLVTLLVISILPNWAQGAKSIRITEVMTDNRTSIIDEYGKHKPWVELSNSSFTTYNVRGMFITTDRSVLDANMTPEERRKHMSPLPNNEARTTLSGKKSLVVYDKAWMRRGPVGQDASDLQLPLRLRPGQPNWVAIYDGNAVDLIDSVSVPVLPPDHSFALSADFKQWTIAGPGLAEVTPGHLPQHVGLSKAQAIKQTDPYGVGIAVLAMGIVFFCLALLYIFFSIFGSIMRKREESAAANEAPVQAPQPAAAPVQATDDEDAVYMAVIAMALREHLDNKHDIEGCLTIRPKQSRWSNSKNGNY